MCRHFAQLGLVTRFCDFRIPKLVLNEVDFLNSKSKIFWHEKVITLGT